MPEREKPAARKKRGPASKKAADAGRANLAKGREVKDAARAKAREEGREPASSRWAKLLSGTLTVKDLDDEELAKMRVRGKDGGFSGSRKPIPSHLAQQMQQEAIKRANDQFRLAAPKAVKRLLEIAEDSETKDADAIRALQIILERSLGKTPEVIRIDGASPFDAVTMEALGLDRDVADGVTADE